MEEFKQKLEETTEKLLAERAPKDEEEKTESKDVVTIEIVNAAEVAKASKEVEVDAISVDKLSKVDEAAQNHAAWTCCGW